MRNTKTASQQKKGQDKVGHRLQPRLRASSTKKQLRKRPKSADSGSKSGSKLSKSELAPSSGVEVDSMSSGSKDRSEHMDRNVVDSKGNDKVTRTSTGVSHQPEIPSLAKSKSNSNTTRRSSRSHTPLLDQQTQSSTVDSIKQKCVSDGTESSPNPVPPPTSGSSPSPVFTILTRSQRRQSIQFTENSLKVSFKRTQSLSPPAPVPFVPGTNLDASPSTSTASTTSTTSTTSTRTVKRNSSKKPSTDSSSTTELEMPSSQQLAEFFSSMTPLPAPVSPKRKQPPSGSRSIGTNSQVVRVSRFSSTPSSSSLPPRSNGNISALACGTITTPQLSCSSARNVPSISHSDAPSSANSVYGTQFLPCSNTSANASNVISTPLIPHSSSNNYSSNIISASLCVLPQSSAATTSTPSVPLISNVSTSNRPPNVTTMPQFPYSGATTTIGAPNLTGTPLKANLGTSSKSSSATNIPHSSITVTANIMPNMPLVSKHGTSLNVATMPQIAHSSITNRASTPNSISTPLISSLGANTPNSTNTPPGSYFGTSLNAATMPQVSHSSATATCISAPNLTNTALISNLGASTPNSTNMPLISNLGTSPSVTTMPQVPHSSAMGISTPNLNNAPLISNLSTSTPNTTNMPLASNLGTSLNVTTMPQIPRSSATAISTPMETTTPLISNLGTSTPNSTIMPPNSNFGSNNTSSNPTLSSPPSSSSPTTHYSITTQARLTSEPSASMLVAQSENQSSHQTAKGKTKPPKPTFSSIYQQLVADKKIKPSKGAGKKPPRKKKSAPSLPPTSTVGGGAGTMSKGLASEKVAKKSTKQGLSSKLSSPLCTSFPTFMIPHIPMGGGGTDPNLLVSPVWLGPGSFSGLMSTMPYQAPPPAAPPIAPPTVPPTSSSGSSGIDSAWSQGPSLSLSPAAQVLPTSTSTDPLRVNSFSTTTVASHAASNQPSSFGFSSPQQFGSFHSSIYSGLPTFPVDLQLNPPANNSVPGVSSSGSSEKAPPHSSTASNTTAAKNANNEKQNTTAKSGHKRPSKLISSSSKAAKKGSTPTSQTTASSTSTVSSSPESSRPHIDMYPDSPPAANRQTGKTLQYRPLNEFPHSSSRKSPNTPHSFHNPTQTRSLSTSSTTPMSPPTHIPTNKPGRFRFPSISSPLTLPSSLPSTTFSSLTTMLKSPTTPATLSSPSLTAQLVTVGNSTALSSSSYKMQDVNSMEYRKLILKRVQQWNEHKQKMQGHAEGSKLKSPLLFHDGSVLSPTSGDTAYPGQPSGSLNLSPSLRSALVSSPTDAPGFTSHFKVTGSLPNASRESSQTSTILGLSSPKLLTVGPPVTFADTLPPCSISNPPSSLELKSPSTTSTSVTPSSPNLKSLSVTSSLVTSPTVVPSVVSSAIRMDDILTASYGCSMVAPSVVFNSSFMGDISSMSRWELEQLYKHNMEKLEQQKKFISILEAQLKRVREQHDTFATQKPSESELYKRFLSFVVEPELIPDVSSICSNKFGYGHLSKQSNGAKIKPTLDFNEVIKGGTFDRPVLNEKYDCYANFGRS